MNAAAITAVFGVLRVLFPAVVKALRPTYTEAGGDPHRRAILRSAIRDAWQRGARRATDPRGAQE